MTRRSAAWDDDNIHPIKGPKGDTAFLRGNYKISTIGSVFRTPKAKFSPTTIHAEAEKAGWDVRVDEDGPWLKVVITGNARKYKTAYKEKKAEEKKAEEKKREVQG